MQLPNQIETISVARAANLQPCNATPHLCAVKLQKRKSNKKNSDGTKQTYQPQ